MKKIYPLWELLRLFYCFFLHLYQAAKSSRRDTYVCGEWIASIVLLESIWTLAVPLWFHLQCPSTPFLQFSFPVRVKYCCSWDHDHIKSNKKHLSVYSFMYVFFYVKNCKIWNAWIMWVGMREKSKYGCEAYLKMGKIPIFYNQLNSGVEYDDEEKE